MIPDLETRDRSRLGGLDPRTRLLSAFGMAVVFSVIRDPALLGMCLAFSVVLVAACRLPVIPLLKGLALANVFVLFMAATLPLTVPGTPLAQWGPLGWSREGLELALALAVRSNAVLLSFFALVGGMGLPRIGCALAELRVPEKLVFLFLFTSRYIHVIGEEWTRLRTAARLRGFVPDNSRHTYRTLAHLLGLTFIGGLDRARRIHEAMLLRGFRGSFRTITELRSRPADGVVLTLVAAGLAGLVLWDLLGK